MIEFGERQIGTGVGRVELCRCAPLRSKRRRQLHREPPAVRYELVSGDLVIRDETGATMWRGKPGGYPVKLVSSLDTEDGAVVLLDPMAGPNNFANLLRVRIDGTVAWQAKPPDQTANDAWVEFRWEGGELVANSWSCYQVRIDPENGIVRSRTFTK